MNKHLIDYCTYSKDKIYAIYSLLLQEFNCIRIDEVEEIFIHIYEPRPYPDRENYMFSMKENDVLALYIEETFNVGSKKYEVIDNNELQKMIKEKEIKEKNKVLDSRRVALSYTTDGGEITMTRKGTNFEDLIDFMVEFSRHLDYDELPIEEAIEKWVEKNLRSNNETN